MKITNNDDDYPGQTAEEMDGYDAYSIHQWCDERVE